MNYFSHQLLCLNSPVSGPLLDLPSFKLDMIKWDAMHIINLGCDLWVAGSVLKKLLTYNNQFGGDMLDDADRLLIAYDHFRNWSRRNHIQYLGLPKSFFYIDTTLFQHILFALFKTYRLVLLSGTACPDSNHGGCDQSSIPGRNFKRKPGM